MSHWEGKRTICEVLREVLETAERMNELIASGGCSEIRLFEGVFDITVKTHEAVDMAKCMDRKLRVHKEDYDRGMWRDA